MPLPFSPRTAHIPILMAANLVDLVVPGLGSTLSLLYAKYSELKEGKSLCERLHQRLKDFTDELRKISPDTFQAEELLQRLRNLIEEYSQTVTTFAEQRNFVKRVLKLDKFSEDIKIYNERLDSIIDMISVKQTEKLVDLLKWREQYESDAEAMFSQLTVMLGLQKQIWLAMNAMATKQDIEDLVMRVKRDMTISSEPDHEPDHGPQHLDSVLHKIVAIGEEHFLDGKSVRTPPTWLIATDEVVTSDPPIDAEGLTTIYVGVWQGAKVAVKKFDVMDESPVFDKHFKVWRSLLHPHVAQLFGAGSEHGAPFFVYEYASRMSLDRCWGELSQKDLWRLLHQTSLALLYLHKRHVVHGNLSCSKLLVSSDWNVKLFGFGASYFRENSKSNSAKPYIPEDFAAPECIGIGPSGNLRGDRHSPRFQSDVYSFGLTIMEAIGKRDPFFDKSAEDIRTLKRYDQYKKPGGMNDDAWILVKQMCVCDPSKRASLAYVSEQLGRLAQ